MTCVTLSRPVVFSVAIECNPSHHLQIPKGLKGSIVGVSSVEMAQSTSSGSATTTGSFISIPQTAAAGGLSFTQPPQTGAASFFKIAPSQPITFGWNFTSLIVTPTHLTVSAICDNGNTYPVGPTDGVIPGTATNVVWDVYSYQQANPSKPLAQESYTLTIWDDRGSDAPRLGGYLSPNSGLRFALYTPQSYTPLSSWTCAGCNIGGAVALASHPLFVALVATFTVMFLSGWNVLRRH